MNAMLDGIHTMRDRVNATANRVHVSHGHMNAMLDGIHSMRDRIHMSHGHTNVI